MHTLKTSLIVCGAVQVYKESSNNFGSAAKVTNYAD